MNGYLTAFLAIAWVSGFLSGSIGFASGVVPTVLLMLLAPASTAVPSLAPVVLTGAVLALATCWGEWKTRHVLVTTVPLLGGTWLGTEFLSSAPEQLFRRVIGLFVIVSAIPEFLEQFRRDQGASQRPWFRRLAATTTGGAVLGFVGGITSAVAHAGGIVVAIHLVSLRLGKRAFTATMLAVLVVADVAKLVSFAHAGLFSADMLTPVAAALPFVLGGVYLGRRAHDSISTRRFQQLVAAVLLVVGVVLVAG